MAEFGSWSFGLVSKIAWYNAVQLPRTILVKDYVLSVFLFVLQTIICTMLSSTLSDAKSSSKSQSALEGTKITKIFFLTLNTITSGFSQIFWDENILYDLQGLSFSVNSFKQEQGLINISRIDSILEIEIFRWEQVSGDCYQKATMQI